MTICLKLQLNQYSHSPATGTGQLGSTRTAAMQGRADGDGGRAKGNTKKRDLDDALKVGLGAGNPDAKRRHTAAGPSYHYDGSTPNSSSFHSGRRDVKRHDIWNSIKSQLDTFPFSSRPSGSPAPQAYQSLRPPDSGDSAAKAPGASGASQSTRGGKPGLPGGLFSGVGHHKSKQNSVPNGPPTSSSTSSDASPIPAGSTEALSTEIYKQILRKSSQPLRYGYKLATQTAAGKGNPQSKDRSAQEARSHNAGHTIPGSQRRLSNTQDKILRPSRLKSKRRPVYDDSLSDDGSYLEDDDDASDDNEDKHATSFPKKRQSSNHFGSRGSSGSLLGDNSDGGLNGERKSRQLSYDKTPSGLRLDSLSSSVDADQDSTSPNHSDLDRAMADSKVWTYVAPFVPPTWTTTITDDLERSAFIQAISLPLRNKMDMDWLAGTKKSHQRIYRALMSIVFQAIGVEACCKPCESKILERRRNCKVLPPEAEGMRELQEVYGSQCVNCYFFHAAKPCEFPSSSTTTKETPIPVPTPPVMRPIPNVERSLDPSSVARPPPAVTRPHAPTYSSYKATKADKFVSESPVPIPSFARQVPNQHGRSTQTSGVSAEIPPSDVMLKVLRSGRVTKTDDQYGGGSSFKGSDNTDEAESHSAASNAGASEATLASSGTTSGGPSIKESTAAASSVSSAEVSSSQLAGRAFSLFGDMSRLPVDEQAALWNQMQQMAGILQTGVVTKTSITKSTPPNLPSGLLAAAAEWEIAPGRLIVDDKHLAFSTSFLSREVVSLKAAQQLSPTQRVLNKSIAALNQLSVRREEGWDCTCSVIRGMLKMKAGDVEARIGQGGVIVVEKECIITNISHKEARIQVWWKKVDD